jgi:hypothetical protein
MRKLAIAAVALALATVSGPACAQVAGGYYAAPASLAISAVIMRSTRSSSL